MLKAANLRVAAYEAKIEWFKKKIEALNLTLRSDDPAIEQLREKIQELKDRIAGLHTGDEDIENLKKQIE